MGAHLEIPPTLSTPLPPFSRPPTSPSLITCTLTHIHSRGPKSTYTSFHFIPPTSWSPTTSQIKNFWVLTTPSLGKAAPFLFFSLKWAYFFLRILQTKNILKSECAPWETPPSPLVSHASQPPWAQGLDNWSVTWGAPGPLSPLAAETRTPSDVPAIFRGAYTTTWHSTRQPTIRWRRWHVSLPRSQLDFSFYIFRLIIFFIEIPLLNSWLLLCPRLSPQFAASVRTKS